MARTDTLEHYLTDLADSIRAKTGETGAISASSFDSTIEGIPSGSSYTGHVDTNGLLNIGWSQNDIDDFQQNGVDWNEEEDNYYKVYSSGTDNTSARYYQGDPKIMFQNYLKLLTIKSSDLVNASYQSTFNGCRSLKYLPEITLSGSNTSSSFGDCTCLKRIKSLSMPYTTDCYQAFYQCYSLEKIDSLSVLEGFSGSQMFTSCYSLKYIGVPNNNKLKPSGNCASMFSDCYNLKSLDFLDTSKITNLNGAFQNCYSLTDIPLLDFGNITSLNTYSFMYCYSLRTVGGFKDYGKSFSTSASANKSNYTLNISSGNLLTHDSLMNIINNLYDIASMGCNTQKLILGSTNLAKLTAEEIAIATNKGWTVS